MCICLHSTYFCKVGSSTADINRKYFMATMKRIKFIARDPHQHDFAVALRKNVMDYFKTNNISTKGDSRMIIKTIIMLSMYLAPFILILTIPMNTLTAVLMLVVMGIGMAGVGMSVMHDAIHGSYSPHKWVNKLAGASIYFIGSSPSTWAIQHNILHHTYSNVTGYDEDIETKGFVRLSKDAPWKKYQRFQQYYAFLFYGFMTLAKLFGDLPQLLKYNRTGLTREQNDTPVGEVIRMLITKTVYLVAIIGLPLWLTDFSWWQILVGFLIMHMVGGMIMSTIFQLAHVVEGATQTLPDEQGIIREEWMVHQLNTTSDFARNNWLLNWYVGGLNYQIEHHLFSNICHIHYPALAPIVERTAREYGIAYNLKPSFFQALRSHIMTLVHLGKQPIPA